MATMAQPPKASQDNAPRRGRAGAIGADAGAAAQAAFARAGFADPALVLHWEEIAGAEVARLARPVSLKDGVLTVLAEPAAALFLAHESRTLMGRINNWAGRQWVDRVKFVQGQLESRPPAPTPRQPGKAAKPGDPALQFQGPGPLKSALESLARWRATGEDRPRPNHREPK